MLKIKIHYQFATAKGKTKNGNAEISKRLKFINTNIDKNSLVKLSIPQKGPGSIETEYDDEVYVHYDEDDNSQFVRIEVLDRVLH